MGRISPGPTRWPSGAKRRLVPAKSNLKSQTVTNPTARALARWLCVLWGRREEAQGGRLSPGCGASGVGRSPTPDRLSLRRAAGARYPLAVGAGGVWGPVTKPTARALARWLGALWGRREGARGGGVSCLGVGRPVWGALSRPTSRLWGVWPGPAVHWLWVRGFWVWRPVTNPTARALASWLCALWGRQEGAPGGACCAWVCSVRCGALLHPRPPVLGACGRGPLPTGCGCGGCGCGDPPPVPRCALLRAAFARSGGSTRFPGGRGPLAWVRGVRGGGTRARLTARPWGPRPGPATHWLWVRGVWVWGPVTNPTARAFASWLLRAVGAARGRPGRGVSCQVVARSAMRALPCPTACPWGVRPGPATHWLWVRGLWVWGLVTNSTVHTLASWLCGLLGRREGGRGQASLASVWHVRGLALSQARTPVLAACGRGPIPTGCPCGVGGCGNPSPTPQCALLRAGFARRGGGARVPEGGRLWRACRASGIGRSSTPDRPFLGHVAGACYPLAVGWGTVGLRTRHQPHSARSCELAVRAVGAARGSSRGPHLAWVRGVPGWALSNARPPIPGACVWGPLPTGCGCGGFWVWGPVTNPSASALARWLGALWGRRERAQRGGVSCLGVGRMVWGALPRPTARLSGVWPGPAVHWLWEGGVGVETRHQPHSARSCELALRAVEAARGRPGGGASLARVWHVRGWALSHARPPVLGACGRNPLPTGCGCGRCGCGDPSPTQQCALLRAGFARCAGGARAPRAGGVSCHGVARPGLGVLPGPTARPWGLRPEPATHLLRVRGLWEWGPVTHPTVRALASWLGALWGRREGTWGGDLLPRCGTSGGGCSPRPDRPSLGRAAGVCYPLAVGAGDVGVRTRHQPHSARSCELAARAEGAARASPGGGVPLAWVRGVRRRALSHARPPVLEACGRNPLPTGCCCGAAGCGDSSATPRRALLRAGLARCEGGTRAPGGGRLLPGCGASGVGRTSTPDRPSLGRAAGACYQLAGCGGDVGVGTRHQPNSARSCELDPRALEAARVRPGGGTSCLRAGRRGLGALPRPTALLGACGRGPLPIGCRCGGVLEVGPVTNPTARSCELAVHALGAARGGPGGASLAWVAGVRGWALSHARLPVLGACSRGRLPAGCGCWVCARGDPSPTPQHALL